jgi:hypothetical protein
MVSLERFLGGNRSGWAYGWGGERDEEKKGREWRFGQEDDISKISVDRMSDMTYTDIIG